jgi:hypothetical protein
MSNLEQFHTLLVLQEEIDAKIDEFIELVKTINQDHQRNYALVELKGEIYQLRKVDYMSEAMTLCRKHRGFFHDYRLVKLGKAVK